MNNGIDYRNHFVAFIDILGYSNFIETCDDNQAIELIEKFSSIVSDAKKSLESGWAWEEDKFQHKVFSDCICISIPEKMGNFDAFMQLIAVVQKKFHKEQILLRGAVTIGKHFSDENLIFSKALVEAYKIESSIARYPRIIIPKYFWSYVASNGQDEDIYWFKDTYCWFDYTDNNFFIDYLNFMPYERKDEPNHKGYDLLNHKSFIESMLIKFQNNEKIYEKYEWLANYYNSWCRMEYPDYKHLLIESKITNRCLGPFK